MTGARSSRHSTAIWLMVPAAAVDATLDRLLDRLAPGDTLRVLRHEMNLKQKMIDIIADPNIGGTFEFDGGWVRLTPA